MDVIYPSCSARIVRPDGYTLTELLIAVAIAIILLGIAAPSFSDIIKSNRMTGHINLLASHLYYSRSEAIKRGINVVLCKSQDGSNCTTSNSWDDGWIIFADHDSDRQHDDLEPLLVFQQPLEDDINVNFGAFPSPNYVIYYPTGGSRNNGTFTFCDSRGAAHAKALILIKQGRVRHSRTKRDGSQLTCPSG